MSSTSMSEIRDSSLDWRENRAKRQISKPAKLSLIVGYIVGLFIAMQFGAADAQSYHYLIGDCRYDPETINPLHFRFFSVNSNFEYFFNQGRIAWNSSAVPVRTVEHSWGFDPEINVVDRLLDNPDYLAITGGGCGSSGIWYDNETQIAFNTHYLDQFDYSDLNNLLVWIHVATHEIGHAYGLKHWIGFCSIMGGNLGVCTNNYPTPIDVAAVQTIYSDFSN